MNHATHPFNVLLTEDGKRMLAHLATVSGCSRGLIVRQAIHARFMMVANSTPTCASGRPCLVPALHVQNVNAPPVPTQEDSSQCPSPPIAIPDSA